MSSAPLAAFDALVPSVGDDDLVPRGYTRWLLLNALLAAAVAGLTIAPHGLVAAVVWRVWMQLGLRRYSRALRQLGNEAGALGRSLEAAQWAAGFVIIGVALRVLAFWQPVDEWLSGWMLAVTPFMVAWFVFVWAYSRGRTETTALEGWSVGEGRRVAWGARLLIGAPLLFTCVVQGVGMLLMERGALLEEGVAVDVGLWVVFAGYALAGAAGGGLLLYRATVAVWWRRVLGVFGALAVVPFLGALLPLVGVDLSGPDFVGVVWRFSVVLLLGAPVGSFVLAGAAAFLWGHLSALEEPASAPS